MFNLYGNRDPNNKRMACPFCINKEKSENVFGATAKRRSEKSQKQEKKRGEERQRDGLRLDTSLGGRGPGHVPLGS